MDPLEKLGKVCNQLNLLRIKGWDNVNFIVKIEDHDLVAIEEDIISAIEELRRGNVLST